MAVFSGNRTLHFRPELLKEVPDILPETETGDGMRDVIRLADVSGRNCELYHDLTEEHILLRF